MMENQIFLHLNKNCLLTVAPQTTNSANTQKTKLWPTVLHQSIILRERGFMEGESENVQNHLKYSGDPKKTLRNPEFYEVGF